jgi:hypothetical protein
MVVGCRAGTGGETRGMGSRTLTLGMVVIVVVVSMGCGGDERQRAPGIDDEMMGGCRWRCGRCWRWWLTGRIGTGNSEWTRA